MLKTWIAAALIWIGLAGCCAASPRRIARPDRPKLEPIGLIAVEREGDQVWVITDPKAFAKNLERQAAYIHALEVAPFWDGDTPRPE